MQTTPALDLARRFVAAGAPVGSRHAVTVVARDTVSGTIGRDVEGKAYLLATDDGGATMSWLPLLSDPSWLGWTLAEVSRRGYWWCLSSGGAWAATGPRVANHDRTGDIPATLVAMLEATLPPPASPATTPP